MTDDELDAIEARANAATKGPWEIQKHGGAEALFAQCYLKGEPVHGLNLVYLAEPDANWPSNGPFIAAAREDIPLLISELRTARERLKAVSEVVSEWREFAKGVGTYGDILTMVDDLEAALRGGDV